VQPILDIARKLGWLKECGKQRTDSTAVFGAIRTINQLETVGETMRATLNVLATVAPEWLCSVLSPDWFDRYEKRFGHTACRKAKRGDNGVCRTGGSRWVPYTSSTPQ
jgi:hypothetical protein